MTFKLILGDLLAAVPGADGAILADWEGEAVDQVTSMDDYRLKVIGAHKGVILANFREVVRRLEGSELKEIVITSNRMRIVIMPITHEYFLVLTLGRDNALGQALFAMRRCVLQLQNEII